MANAMQSGEVLPRPRILNVLGVLNLVVAAALILMSASMGMYIAILPMTGRAMTQMQKEADADLEARKQADLKANEEAAKTATTASEKLALEEQRKAIEARPKAAIPMGMDFDKIGANDPKLLAWSTIEVATALVLNILLLVAGVGMLRRKVWGLRLGLWTAAAKIVRLFLAWGLFAVVIVPPIAQGMGQMAGAVLAQQQQAIGKPAPPGVDPAFFTRVYFIMLTVMAVAIVLSGSIFPAISLWFLSRPGAQAACDERAYRDRGLTGARVVGILNIIFAAGLIVFGTCMGTYIAALPVIGRTMNQVQKKADADLAVKQKEELEAIEEARAKATTEEEKQDLDEQRKAIESRPKVGLQISGGVDFTQMGLTDPKVQLYYWIEVTSGLILNVALIAAGIALVRRKPWGMGLGIGVAAAKIVRLLLVTTFFWLVAAPVVARQSAEMVARMMVLRPGMSPTPQPAPIDASPLTSVYLITYAGIAVAMFVLGSIYPAISLWVLTRPGALATRDKSTLSPDKELNETW